MDNGVNWDWNFHVGDTPLPQSTLSQHFKIL